MVEEIGKWCLTTLILAFALLFTHAALSQLRTHGRINFDSGVLLWCLCVNLFAIGLEFWCGHIM